MGVHDEFSISVLFPVPPKTQPRPANKSTGKKINKRHREPTKPMTYELKTLIFRLEKSKSPFAMFQLNLLFLIIFITLFGNLSIWSL